MIAYLDVILMKSIIKFHSHIVAPIATQRIIKHQLNQLLLLSKMRVSMINVFHGVKI